MGSLTTNGGARAPQKGTKLMTTEQKDGWASEQIQSLAKKEYNRLTKEMIAIRAKRDWGVDKVSTLTILNALKITMDFDRLLHSESYTFTHDIGGITKHIDKLTGELKGFHPICAKQQ